MIVITGTGRSGTSYIAKLIHNLGWSVAGSDTWIPKINAGFEHCAIGRMHDRLSEGKIVLAKKMLKKLEGYMAVKSPQFVNKGSLHGIDLFEQKYKKKLHIILLRRNFIETAESIQKANGDFPQTGDDWESLHQAYEEGEFESPWFCPCPSCLELRYDAFLNYIKVKKIERTTIDYRKFMKDYTYAEPKILRLIEHHPIDCTKKLIKEMYDKITIRK